MKTLKALAIAIPVGIGLIGSGHSLAGSVDARARAAMPARVGSVYMLRGLLGISGGIDEVAAELNGLGVRATVHEHSDWLAIAEAIEARYRAQPEREPIILVGFSLGGNDVIQLSRHLGAAGIPVDLLVTLDPTIPPSVPANVAQAVDLYQNRAGFRGVPLVADAGFRGGLVNRNLSGLPGIEHHNFPVRPEVRREVVARVLQVARPRAARPNRHMARRGQGRRG